MDRVRNGYIGGTAHVGFFWGPSQRVQIGIVWTYTEEIYGWIAKGT